MYSTLLSRCMLCNSIHLTAVLLLLGMTLQRCMQLQRLVSPACIYDTCWIQYILSCCTVGAARQHVLDACAAGHHVIDSSYRAANDLMLKQCCRTVAVVMYAAAIPSSEAARYGSSALVWCMLMVAYDHQHTPYQCSSSSYCMVHSDAIASLCTMRVSSDRC